MPESNEAECADEKRLFVELRRTLGSLMETQRAHMDALSSGDGQVSRFEDEIRVALSGVAERPLRLYAPHFGSRLPVQQGFVDLVALDPFKQPKPLVPTSTLRVSAGG